MRMKTIRVAVILALMIVLVLSYSYSQSASQNNRLVSEDPRVWQQDIEQFQHEDEHSPAAKGSVLFIGSSSIRLWKTLAQDMQPLPVLARGFGGAKIMDVSYYVSSIVAPYEPAAIVVYVGSNDLSDAMGNTPKTLQKIKPLYQQLVERLKRAAPGAGIYFIALRSVPAAIHLRDEYKVVNQYLESLSKGDAQVHFIDANAALYTASGAINKNFYGLDNIHLNQLGYRRWGEVIRERLLQDLSFSNEQ